MFRSNRNYTFCSVYLLFIGINTCESASEGCFVLQALVLSSPGCPWQRWFVLSDHFPIFVLFAPYVLRIWPWIPPPPLLGYRPSVVCTHPLYPCASG